MAERFLRTWIILSSTSADLPKGAELAFGRDGTRPVYARVRKPGEPDWTHLGVCVERGPEKLCFSPTWGYSEVALGEQADPDAKREIHFGFWKAENGDDNVDPVGAWVAESQGPVGGLGQGS
jgi:hypothetical protein